MLDKEIIEDLYHIVDDRIVYDVIKNNLTEFDKFINEIKKVIKK